MDVIDLRVIKMEEDYISNVTVLEKFAADELYEYTVENTEHGRCGIGEPEGIYYFKGKLYKLRIEIFWNRYDKRFYYPDSTDILSFEEVTIHDLLNN